VSYAQLAQLVGKPNAVRAVAAANGANPLALFVPCHRVIAANGTLWGYGGGLPMKQWLLRHEGAQFTPLTEQESLPL
jgi:methylated-DNA-[protein]-cysteine S-methyltransferase